MRRRSDRDKRRDHRAIVKMNGTWVDEWMDGCVLCCKVLLYILFHYLLLLK